MHFWFIKTQKETPWGLLPCYYFNLIMFFSRVKLKQCQCGRSFSNKEDIECCLWVELLISQKTSFKIQIMVMTSL